MKTFRPKKQLSVTLLELILVIVVIGVIAGFAVPSYLGSRDNALRREADAMVLLIRAAEQARDARGIGYVLCGGTAACNTALDLDLSGINWDYSVTVTTGPDAFCVTAARAGVTSRVISDTIWTPQDTPCP